MYQRKLKHTLQTSVPNPPEVFSRAMRDTLSSIVKAEAQEEARPVRKILTKRRIMIYVIVAALLIASAALAAVLLTSNVFDNTIGTTPENADTVLQKNLAAVTIGNAEIRVVEAAYDGISLFISYSIRDLTATEPMGVYDDSSGMRLPTMQDYKTIDALGVGWWVDHIWIDGQPVNMPGMSGGQDAGTDTPGEILYSTLYRLDQENVYLDGEVQISLPIGKKQPLDSLTINQENGRILLPEQGMITFLLDCSARGRMIEITPEWKTTGARWSATVSRAVFTPIQTYITVDWAVDDSVLQAYIDKNGEGPSDPDGNLYYHYDGYDAVGMEVSTLQPVDAQGVPLFERWDGFYGVHAISATIANFTFPYLETIPDTLYLAPTIDGSIDMQYAIRIR